MWWWGKTIVLRFVYDKVMGELLIVKMHGIFLWR